MRQVGDAIALGEPGAHVRDRPELSIRSSLPRSPIGKTSIQVISMSSEAHHSVRSNNSASLNPRRATVLIDAESCRPGGVDACQNLWQAAPACNARQTCPHPKYQARRLTRRPLRHGVRWQIGPTAIHLSSMSVPSACRFPSAATLIRNNVIISRRTSGFAASDSQLLNSQRDECRTHSIQFLQRQKLFLRQEGHVFRHAVDTAEIATISDRDAQIVMAREMGRLIAVP